jgi:hypothetical protein
MKKTLLNILNTLTLFIPIYRVSQFRKLKSFLELEEQKSTRYTGFRGVVRTTK